MKYIRTKDGIILDYQKMNEITKLSIDMALMEKEIDFRFADTIEELCDLIVVDINSEYFTYYLSGEKGLKTFCQLRDNGVLTENDSVRCYIWIDDKGVKVAEMNDKGDLELL